MLYRIRESAHRPPALDDGIMHLWCCDPDVSLCGLDVSGHRTSVSQSEPLCPDCDLRIDFDCHLCAGKGMIWKLIRTLRNTGR